MHFLSLPVPPPRAIGIFVTVVNRSLLSKEASLRENFTKELILQVSLCLIRAIPVCAPLILN